VNEQEQQLLLEIADDELILGWRDSEWTGIAPLLEEDVAFSSIAQNEIGHARALYELVARARGTTADELAFDRSPDEYRCAQIVELRLLDWGQTIARRSRASPRRSTAKRPTTACTRRCGTTDYRRSRAIRRHSTSCGPCSNSAVRTLPSCPVSWKR
jgi:hypothetical protein